MRQLNYNNKIDRVITIIYFYTNMFKKKFMRQEATYLQPLFEQKERIFK